MKIRDLFEKQNVNAGIMSNPAFRQWFGKSVLVDASGSPLVVFHGTARAFSAFDVATIGDVWQDDKAGFFFTNNPGPDMASGYANAAARSGGAPNVMPVYIRLENPYTFDDYAFEMGYPLSNSDPMHPKHAAEYLDGRGLIDWFDINKDYVINAAQEGGYDGILLIDPSTKIARSGLPENLVVVFSPNQIKSKFNRGTFRTDTDNISEASGEAESDTKNPKTFLSESAQPKIGYHVTATKNLPIIQKDGIKADKRGNSYIWDSREMAEWFMDFQNDEGQDRTIVKVDMSDLDARPDPEADDMSEWSRRFEPGTKGGAWIISGPIPPNKIIGKQDFGKGPPSTEPTKPTTSINFRTWKRDGVPKHSFSVVRNGKEIARGEISKDNEWDDDRGASVQDIVVDYNYRRKGIATKIYNEIERRLNYKLHPSDDVKPDGKEFWNYRSNDISEDFSAVLSKDTDDKIDAQERKRNLDNFLRGNHLSVPKILYHGSRSESDFEVFKPSFGTYGTGIYLTDKPNVASDFAMGIRGGETDEKMGGRVIPLYVSMKHPFIDEYLRHPEWKKYIEDVINKNFERTHLWRREEYKPIKNNILQKLDNGTATIRDLFIDKNNNVLQDLGCNEIVETIHRSGFDGIIINRPDGSIEYVVFKPEQVKSAIGNIGTFDHNKPNINEDTTDNIYYHITPAKNVRLIMKKGLLPKIGRASLSFGETEERVYLFPSLIAAEDAVNNWLGNQEEDISLALLRVDASGIDLKSDVEWEFYTDQKIPPNRIKILSMDM